MRSLTVNDGLPQGAVSGIAQDSRGFIWIASNGLSRYDGRNFVHFRHTVGDTSSLASNTIGYMRMDDRDNLWLIYDTDDVDIFNTITGRIRHISTEKNYKWLNPRRDGSWYIAQEGGRYFKASMTSLTMFDPWGTYRQNIILPPGERLLALGAKRQGMNVVATDKALYEIRGSQLRKVIDFPPASKEGQQFVQASVKCYTRLPGRILKTPNGVLVVPGVDFICLYDEKSQGMNYFPFAGMSWGITQSGGYIYARSTVGLMRFDEQGVVTQLTRFTGMVTQQDKPGDEYLTDMLLIDRSGVLWTTTSGAIGLRLFDLRPVNFMSYRYTNGFLHDALEPWLHNPMQNQVAAGSYLGRCAKDKNGNIWVVSYLATISDESSKKLHWKSRYWSGSGVYRLGTGQAWKLPFHLPGWKVTNIAFDSLNQCWLTITSLTGIGNSLVKADVHTGGITPFAKLPDIRTENWYLTHPGRKICVMTENELRLFDARTAACTVFSKEQLGSDGILLMALPDVHDSRILWLATKGSGIIKLDIETRRVVHYNELNGLPNNTVYYIARDKQGFFWCSSNRGIFRFNPATGTTIAFQAKDGLQVDEFNRYHFMESPGGHFIFGGTEGYTIFHPDSVSTDRFQTPVFISGIQVNNLPLQKAVPALKDSLVNTLQQLTLGYNQNFLSVGFAGLQYNAPEELHYRYRLQGLDEGWIEAGTDASARYAYIPPGRYTFVVNASNTSGLWSNQVKKLQITILSPWWKTAWAYTLYVFVSTAIAYVLYRNWQHRVRDKQRLFLQRKEAEQLKIMDEMKSQFFSNITHEFRTPLSLIIAPVEQMQAESPEPKFKSRLSGVQRNAEQLLQLINQLLDMAKLEAGNMHLSLHRGNLPLFLQNIAGSFAFATQAKQLTITCQLPDADNAEHVFDADKLHKIVQNLLSNAVKFTPTGGHITFRVTLEALSGTMDMLEVSVEDSGIGIAADKLPYIFDRFYQVDDSYTRTYSGTGIGLALVKELIGLLGGTITAVTNTSVQTGMLFTLRLPVAKATGKEMELPPGETDMRQLALQEAPAEQPAVHSGQGNAQPLVLVAEDHEELNTFICDIFNPYYRMLSVRNGREGWQVAQQEQPDVIISDVMMPEGDGMEFCKKVKTSADTSHIAFIMLTARSSQGSVVEGLESRADDYISKPFHADELQLRVRNILDRQQQLRNFYNRQFTVADEPLARTENTDPFLQQVYEQVEKHLDDTEFTVDKLATSVAVSTRTLVRKLQAIAGLTPIELIKQYRLKRAAELLKEGKHISEVAWSVGYETRNYFSTAFKGFYGVTPSEYRKADINN